MNWSGSGGEQQAIDIDVPASLRPVASINRFRKVESAEDQAQIVTCRAHLH